MFVAAIARQPQDRVAHDCQRQQVAVRALAIDGGGQQISVCRRPAGVTNHFVRLFVPIMTVSDDGFIALVKPIGATLNDAVDRCMTCQPEHLIMGMSALMFWDGRDDSERR